MTIPRMSEPRHFPELLRRQSARLGPRIALRHRANGLYHDLSWTVMAERVACVSAALVEAGVRPGDRVGLLAENRVEWILADLAVLGIAAVTVPLHAPLSAKQIAYQLEDSGAVWLFVSTAEQAAKVHEVREELPKLAGVVQCSGPRRQGVHSWEGFEQHGRFALARRRAELERRARDLQGGDLATLMYTSGTTGPPKGVMLTHDNFLSNARAMAEVFGPFDPDTLIFNWLPLSHVYARTVDLYLALVAGLTLALAESPDTVVANLAETKPTCMSSVPRLYEKLLGAVSSVPAPERGDRLRAFFGGRIRWLGCGGAPLPPSVGEAYREAGLCLVPGYGLTESSPVISMNRLEANRLGTVGCAIPGVEITIAPDGEVLTRGPHVMKGYWNQAAATAATLRDGWLHTGDLGELDADGFLRITGRKKELMVLSNGKKVVPPLVEGLMAAEPAIEQAVVYGEGKPFLTALVVPRWPAVRAALPTLQHLSDEELATHPEVCRWLLERIDSALAEVAAWEKVRKIVVVPGPFSVAREELTVSLKLRREVIFGHHRDEMEALYR